MKTWYVSKAAGGRQGMVADEASGRTVAVTYDVADAPLVAASPDLLDALDRILRAHDSKNNGAVMGEAVLCRAFADQARAAIQKARGD